MKSFVLFLAFLSGGASLLLFTANDSGAGLPSWATDVGCRFAFALPGPAAIGLCRGWFWRASAPDDICVSNQRLVRRPYRQSSSVAYWSDMSRDKRADRERAQTHATEHKEAEIPRARTACI
jgi:hypothetical protein